MTADGLEVEAFCATSIVPLASRINMSKSSCVGVHVPWINISLVGATLAALTVRVKSLHELGTVQSGGPKSPVSFVVSGPSEYVIVGFPGLRAPLAGVGALGPVAGEILVNQLLLADVVLRVFAIASESRNQLLIRSSTTVRVRQIDIDFIR